MVRLPARFVRKLPAKWKNGSSVIVAPEIGKTQSKFPIEHRRCSMENQNGLPRAQPMGRRVLFRHFEVWTRLIGRGHENRFTWTACGVRSANWRLPLL